jgi:CheY-like chemotaxis protein/HPt (histidine-containing phosphotransfer) domain-containing protein
MVEAAAEGTLVLLVVDHPVNRALLEHQLNTLGYAVQAAQDGQEALDRWRSGCFGLVLTDCQMPGMTGYELARNIRQREADAGSGHVPIIACTALALPEERERCLQAGMSDVLFKPVGLRTMMEALQRWLPLPEQRSGAAIEIQAGRTRPNGSEVVDREYLEATWGPDPKRIQAILDSYARSTREDIAELQRAITRRDLDAAMQMAHRMLGASRMVGARGISESCELIYSGGRAKNWDALTNAMDALDAEYLRLMGGLSPPSGGARG